MSRYRRAVIAGFFLLSGLGSGWAVHHLVGESERTRTATRFEGHFRPRAFAFEEELSAIFEVLHATRSLFDSSTTVTREEFITFTAALRARHPSIRALEWAPLVSRRDREAHEREARREGLEEYRVRSLTPDESWPEQDHMPVLYVEPLAGNEAALGLDLRCEATREEALVRAVETGSMSLTRPLVLAQEPGRRAGFLGFLAVYEARPRTPEDRWASLKGVVVLVFSAEPLLLATLRRLDERRPALMNVRLVDAQAPGDPLASTLADGDDVHASEGAWSEHRIAVGGQSWLLEGRPTISFRDDQSTLEPIGSAIVAGVIWVLLAVLGLTLIQVSRNRARRRLDHLFRCFIRSLNEGVVVADREGRFQFFNEAAEGVLGIGALDIAQIEWSPTYGCFRDDGETPYPSDELPLSRAIRGEVTPREEMLIRNASIPDGLWIRIGGTPLRDERGTLIGGVVSFVDITERRLSEERLRRLSSAVEQTADLVFITDRKGTIQYVNRAFEEGTGYTRDEAIGQTPRILKSRLTDPLQHKELWATILRGEVFRNTTVNRHKNGRLMHVEQTITPMRSPGGKLTHFVSVCKDMTERRLLHERELEMRLAAVLQNRLYPCEAPRVAGLELAGTSIPATITSGDYFDYIPLADGRLGIAVGDVSGHGLGAAFPMAMARAYLRALVGTNGGDIGRAVSRANDFLDADLDDDQFVTLILASIDPATRSMTWVNAGHVPGFVLDANGKLRAELGRTGMPLGIRSGDLHAAGSELILDPGDVIVFCTDGVTERRCPDGEFFETDRLLEVVRAHRDEPAREIVDRAHRAVRDFGGGARLEDDVSIVVCKVESL